MIINNLSTGLKLEKLSIFEDTLCLVLYGIFDPVPGERWDTKLLQTLKI